MGKNSNPIDIKNDRSDVLSLLTTISVMFTSCKNTLNEYSRTSLLLSIAIEGQMLLMKLRTMYERWQTHLPFKEASGVDFYEWVKEIEDMCQQLDSANEETPKKNSSYCPSKHFLLDLYAMLPRVGQETAQPYYKETSIPEFMRTQERMRKTIASRWPEYKHKLSEHTLQCISDRQVVDLKPFHDNSAGIQRVCCDVLSELAAELSRLSDMSLRVVKGDEYARLAERIVFEPDYEGLKAKREAQAYFSNWKNSIPEEQAENERKYEIDMAINFISEMKYGRFLGRYVHLRDDMQKQMKGFGRFLYTYRFSIGIDELHRLMEMVYRIHFFLEDENTSRQEVTEKKTLGDVMNETADTVDMVDNMTPDDDTTLPTFFDHNLRASAEAVTLLLEILRRAGKYIGCNLTRQEKASKEGKLYVRWKWHYLLQAFKEMGLIGSDTTQVDFASFLAGILSRKKENILQSIYRNCDKKDLSVVADIREEFKKVKALMK